MEGKPELQTDGATDARRKELENFQQASDNEWLNSRRDEGRIGRSIAVTQRKTEMVKDFQEKGDNLLHRPLYSDKDSMKCEEKDKMARNVQYGKDLQQQIVSRQRQRQCEYEDTLMENKMLEKINRSMADENQRVLQTKREESEKLRIERVTSTQAREAWKDKQKEMIYIEERQVEQQRQVASDRSSAVIAEREHKIQMKNDFDQKMAAKILSDEDARLERENIVTLHQEQEYFEKNAQDDDAEWEKSLRVKKELMEALTSQMEVKKRDVLREKEVEAEYRRQAEAQMVADDQKELERTKQIKEKDRQYSEDLLRQIEDNARRRAHENQLEDARAHYERERDGDWRSDVIEERAKLSQHAAPDQESLKVGTITTSDLPTLRDGDNIPGLEGLNINASGIKQCPQ